MIHKNTAIAAVLLTSLLVFTSCKNNDNTSNTNISDIQSIANSNIDSYMQAYGIHNLEEITQDKKLSEMEKVLYDFIRAITTEDYPVAMRLSNYGNQQFLTDEDFIKGLSLNPDYNYNYSSAIGKDIKNMKFSITPDENTPDIMYTTVLIENNYTYYGMLVRLNNEWRVAITGLADCIFEVPTGEKLTIDGVVVNKSSMLYTKEDKDIYRLTLLNNSTYTTNGTCISATINDQVNINDTTVTFNTLYTEADINEFIEWEKNFYNNMYNDMLHNGDLSNYFANDELIKTAQEAIKTQKSKKVTNITIDDIYPTNYVKIPIKKISTNELEANVTIVISYTYTDNSGKLHTKDKISDTKVRAIFVRENEESSWKMSEILGTDPILTNSKFSAI